ncbi:MAG: hypothetical protein RBU27_06470 [Bacteroidota bacterium]|jgi:hypothetical protein|nr:hypothetical protein [Bacteroidota bacterium]
MKRHLLPILLVSLTLAPAIHAQYTLDQRRDSIRTFFRDADVGVNYASATACVLDPRTRADGLAMLEELTTNISPDVIERCRMTAAYIRLHDVLSDSMRARIEYIWGNIPVRPFDGEHEQVGYYASLYLMTRAESAHGFFNGRSRSENEQDARAWLLHWMQDVTEYGQRDFDSPTYAALVLSSLLLLRDHAPDEDMRLRAELMAQWMLADFAHDYLNGAYCGAHGREHMMSAMNPIASDMSGVGWLYFGDGPRVYGREQLFLALSDFTPLPAIVDLATHRPTPYESWERKRSAPVTRSVAWPTGKTISEDVVRYTYMHPLFAMGSIPGGLTHPREQHSWDVTWIPEHPEHPATLFVMHPYSDPAILTPFMPHGTEVAYRTANLLDPYFGTVTKTVGGSPFEDVFQHENTLIALYDIGDVSRFPVIAGFFPSDVRALDIDSLHSKWITINTGDVYLAVYPLAPYRLAKGMLGQVYLSAHRRNGVIVHAAGRNTAGSYAQFRKAIRATVVDTSRFASERAIAYTTIDGDRFEFTFNGARMVNGRTPAMKEDMLFDSPRLHSKRGTGVLTIRTRNGAVVIDMRAKTVR